MTPSSLTSGDIDIGRPIIGALAVPSEGGRDFEGVVKVNSGEAAGAVFMMLGSVLAGGVEETAGGADEVRTCEGEGPKVKVGAEGDGACW